MKANTNEAKRDLVEHTQGEWDAAKKHCGNELYEMHHTGHQMIKYDSFLAGIDYQKQTTKRLVKQNEELIAALQALETAKNSNNTHQLRSAINQCISALQNNNS